MALLAGSVIVGMVTGCANPRQTMEKFSRESPKMVPEQFFAGRTHSWGVFEMAKGAPTQVLTTKTVGVPTKDGLRFEQELRFSGKQMHRSWLVRKVGEDRYLATGTGIVGVAHGETSGNVFHLDFTLDALPGNPLGRVRMSQWMYLQQDGRTLVNRGTMTKAGIVVAQVSEQFQKGR